MPILNSISSIRTGVYLQPLVKGDARYLQIKDFNSRGEFTGGPVAEIQMEIKLERHLLKQGDILFAAKGSKNFAAVISELAKPSIASSAFFVIRQSSGYLPEFLAWYINNDRVQKKLKSEAKGSAIYSIPIGALEALEITLPDIKTQELIVQIDKLRSREKELSYELDEIKDSLIHNKILSKIKQ